MSAVSVGTRVDALQVPPIDREVLANYADASGDHAAVHLDTEYARAMGFSDVIAHGLLVMAYLGRAVTSWRHTREMREFSCRFMTVTYVDDRLTCDGAVTAIRAVGPDRLADLELRVINQDGDVKIKGNATVVLQAARV
ncbi:MAG: MaoC/PaaZ C-terminal domain-containing protein [Steroidobacteraceae bacterium]